MAVKYPDQKHLKSRLLLVKTNRLSKMSNHVKNKLAQRFYNSIDQEIHQFQQFIRDDIPRLDVILRLFSFLVSLDQSSHDSCWDWPAVARDSL